MEGFGGSGGSRNRRITMASSTSRGGSRPPPLCGGRRRVVATKKHGWSNPLSVNNSVKKLQRREISSKPDRSAAITKSLHRFRNFRLTERYDIHDPVGQCSLVLPLLMKRAKVVEIVVVHDIVFSLASSGVCAAFSRDTNKRICFLNIYPDEVIRSLFYNKNNDSLITVSVYASDNFSSLKCRSIRIEYIQRGKPDEGFPLFETESLKWPGFVEFDDVNEKVLTYSAQDRAIFDDDDDDEEGIHFFYTTKRSRASPCPTFLCDTKCPIDISPSPLYDVAVSETYSLHFSIYKVFDLKNYTLLYSIADKHVEEIKISPGIMLLIFSRGQSHVPLKILSIEDGTVLKDFNHLLHRNKKVDFIEQFNEKLLVKQDNENLQILDVRNAEVKEVGSTEFMTPSAFIFLYENQLFLTFRNQTVSVWNFRGELVTSFEDHVLSHPDCNTNNIYITSDQDLIVSFCKADNDQLTDRRAGSINISNIWTGKCIAKINSSNAIASKDEEGSSSTNGRRIEVNMVEEALEDITALYFDEERNEIYTGNSNGLVHVWSD